MTTNIVFIHGMFQNSKSWASWQTYFENLGFATSAPSWPYHEGEPAELRRNPPQGLGELHLRTVIDEFAGLVRALPDKPVVVGHSVGGLIAQELASPAADPSRGLYQLGRAQSHAGLRLGIF